MQHILCEHSILQGADNYKFYIEFNFYPTWLYLFSFPFLLTLPHLFFFSPLHTTHPKHGMHSQVSSTRRVSDSNHLIHIKFIYLLSLCIPTFKMFGIHFLLFIPPAQSQVLSILHRKTFNSLLKRLPTCSTSLISV